MNRKFAERLANIYMDLGNKKGPIAAASWANRTLPNKADQLEVRDAIRRLRGLGPSTLPPTA